MTYWSENGQGVMTADRDMNHIQFYPYIPETAPTKGSTILIDFLHVFYNF